LETTDVLSVLDEEQHVTWYWRHWRRVC